MRPQLAMNLPNCVLLLRNVDFGKMPGWISAPHSEPRIWTQYLDLGIGYLGLSTHSAFTVLVVEINPIVLYKGRAKPVPHYFYSQTCLSPQFIPKVNS